MFEARVSSRVAESAGNQVRTSAMPPPHGPRGAVESELSEQDATLEMAHSRLSALITRLEPVLRAAPPSSEPGAAGVPAMTSALADKVFSQKRVAQYLLTRIDELIDRVDL